MSGGVQDVVAKDPNDKDQIALIRMHIMQEANRFKTGDFSDPSALHGVDMPGIKTLEKGIEKVQVTYSQLDNGARITFETDDLKLLTAIHRWFGAQLSDHGKDATYR